MEKRKPNSLERKIRARISSTSRTLVDAIISELDHTVCEVPFEVTMTERERSMTISAPDMEEFILAQYAKSINKEVQEAMRYARKDVKLRVKEMQKFLIEIKEDYLKDERLRLEEEDEAVQEAKRLDAFVATLSPKQKKLWEGL